MTKILINRAVVEQALEALELSLKLLPDVLGGKRSNAASAARKALAEPKEKPWRCACGANLYIDENGAPRSKA